MYDELKTKSGFRIQHLSVHLRAGCQHAKEIQIRDFYCIILKTKRRVLGFQPRRFYQRFFKQIQDLGSAACSWSTRIGLPPLHLLPRHCKKIVGIMLTPMMSAAATPALAAIPTLVNISGNLQSKLSAQYSQEVKKGKVERTKMGQ